VLIKNQISPILLVAFTNHALDHMLKGVLDADITKNIIRLGSRYAADERIAQFSLDEAEKLQSKSKLDRSINAAYRELKSNETEMAELMKKVASRQIPQDHIEDCILSLYPYHHEELFSNPPSWVSTLTMQASQEGWETVGESEHDLSIISFWASGRDLTFLETPMDASYQQAGSSQAPASGMNPFSVLSEDAQQASGNSSEFFQIDIIHMLTLYG
jgi:hypothetical protein